MTFAAIRSLVERDFGPRRWAWLALVFNLPFVLFRAQRTSFDTYVHIFFADHYRANWWSLWEPRWYLGFSVASYPPLVHQLIALLSWPANTVIVAFAPGPEPYPGAFRWLGEEAAYVVVLLAALCLFPAAVHAFARVFVGPRAAGWAAALAVGLPALHLTAWAFGQLPTLVATAIILLALARGAEFMRSASRLALAQAVTLAAVAGATHHAVFLFVPAAGAAVVARVLMGPGRPRTRRDRLNVLWRVGLWAALSAIAAASMLWPFLAWGRGQAMQAPIDHPSRHNFFVDPQATLFFFWPVYGPLLLLIPTIFRLARRAPRLRPLALVAGVLLVLSLGGTTPLPRWFFGAGWEWLTYDRFGLWAAICLLPMVGGVLLLIWRHPRQWVVYFGLGLVAATAATGQVAGWLSAIAHAQPPALDLAPLVRFLDEPAQRPYRYLTLGFGDQLAKLSTLTVNGTPDGSYHTARQLPELRSSGLGALDGALWNPQGVWALQPILRQPQRYGLRWTFSNHPTYVPVLLATGWTFRFYVGDVMAWEHADVKPMPSPAPVENPAAVLWWGIAPLAVLGFAGLAAAWPLRVRWSRAGLLSVVSAARRASWTLTVVLLSLWWVHIVRGGAGDLPHIYWLYQSVPVFASDVALALTLILWAVERWLRRELIHLGPKSVAVAGAAFIGACALSARAAPDRSLTFALTLHLSLLAGLYVMLVNDPPSKHEIGLLFGGVVLAQSLVALTQVFAQSTTFLRDLYLPWPGVLTAETRGASVVAGAEGQRWLRAYGTLPHPNLLGAMLLAYLGPTIERFVSTGRRRWLIVIGLCTLAVFLTFSRTAWLGAAAAAGAALTFAPREAQPRLRVAAALGAAAMLAGALPLSGFLLNRMDLGVQSNALERASIMERTLLLGYGLEAWRVEPLTGVGAGNFVQWAARNLDQRLPFEPVHSLPILILAETGAAGGVAALALLGAVAKVIWRDRRNMSTAGAFWTAALVSVLVTSLFDHGWWTQAPARTLAVAVIALAMAREIRRGSYARVSQSGSVTPRVLFS